MRAISTAVCVGLRKVHILHLRCLRIGKYDPIKAQWTIEPRDKRAMDTNVDSVSYKKGGVYPDSGVASVPFPPKIGKYDPVKAKWTIEPRDKTAMKPPKSGVGSVPFPDSVGKYNCLTHEWAIEPRDKRYLDRTQPGHAFSR